MPDKIPDFAGRLRKQLDKLPTETTGTTSPSDNPDEIWWSRSTDEVVAGMALLGDPVPTGCPFIDRELRHGGVPVGKVVCVGGPPQSGKSYLFAQFMLHIGQSNRVYTLMADAGPDDTAVSLSSLMGFDRVKIEKNPSTMAPEVKIRMEGSTIVHVNPGHPQATLTQFLAYVAEDCHPDLAPVVFVDSAQVIRHGLSDAEVGDMSHSEAVGYVLRRFVARRRAIAFVSSKANRAFFKNRNKADNTTAISSFMGGDIEYTCDAAIVLSRPDKTSGFIGLEWPKNRLGPPSPQDTALRFDPTLNRLVEIDQAELDAAGSKENSERLRPIKSKMKLTLRGKPPLSKNAIYELIRGNRNDVFAAIDAMLTEKNLDASPTPSGSSFRYQLVDRYEEPIPPS